MKRKLTSLLILALCLAGTVAAESAETPTLSPSREIEIEQRLFALGYHSDRCDDFPDEESAGALRAFQRANHLPVTGEADEETLALLAGDRAVSCSEYLIAISESYTGRALLQHGSTGKEVTTLQTALKQLGYYTGECDGIYGNITTGAVRLFQMACGLEQTGIATHSTFIRLYEGSPLSYDAFIDSMCISSRGDPAKIRTLQRLLQSLGYFTGTCSGTFGSETIAAIDSYQSDNGLESTGAFDRSTVESIILKYSEDANAGTSAAGGVSATDRRLYELGYLCCEDGIHNNVSSDNALRLFMLVNGCESAEDAKGLMQREDTPILNDVSADRLSRISSADASVAEKIAATANALRGLSAQVHDCSGYVGFCFVQSVLLENGLPVACPQDLLTLKRTIVSDYDRTQPGDVVFFSRSPDDWTQLTFGICTQPGFVTYATEGCDWILESSIESLATDEVSLWTAGGAHD